GVALPISDCGDDERRDNEGGCVSTPRAYASGYASEPIAQVQCDVDDARHARVDARVPSPYDDAHVRVVLSDATKGRSPSAPPPPESKAWVCHAIRRLRSQRRRMAPARSTRPFLPCRCASVPGQITLDLHTSPERQL